MSSSKSLFNHPAPDAIELLLTRRSGSAKAMGKPGPSKPQLAQILRAGARVPDHGKLFPWHFIVFEGKGRERFGDILATVLEGEGERPKHIEEERERFLRAPLVIGVISSAREMIKVPVWEQQLSAGAACQNILIAAHALGFVGNWLSEWYAYHPAVLEKMGLKPGERVAGFIYIGTSAMELEERPRPEMDAVVSYFSDYAKAWLRISLEEAIADNGQSKKGGNGGRNPEESIEATSSRAAKMVVARAAANSNHRRCAMRLRHG